ncbi:unnamed protein product [Oppiella nova]|uniref:Chitin-binding type-4 domain-containing protein n=1 Tax=Oppiella nova TaxID=334625 RepID=A0A7R9M3I1_9ACAR|nr:unnamed protein product [Oppiella nova]CAG2170078.1 unnamed protein product [Oppiella nova]
MRLILLTIFIALYCSVLVDESSGHGYIADPPSRSSAWRFGFPTVPNYDDNQLFCGGLDYQWKKMAGKCGICGDPYGGPLDNELPNGKYAKHLVITRSYKKGQRVDAKVNITANHMGFFQFKLCEGKTMAKEVTQDCLDSHTLQVLESKDKFKYNVPSEKPKVYTVPIKLPDDVQCERCVIQWTYTAGNSWGQCPNGTYAEGCGPQETFRGCADVKIA